MKNEGVLRGRDSRLGFIEEDRAKIYKQLMEKTINKENKWDHMVETDVVDGPVEKVTCKEMVEVMRKIKLGKAIELTKVWR